jgi:glycosyltransferase involved in cell wall biosynthesis
MRVFVQIPCLNEEATLPLVINSIPREIPGVDEVVILVIDDGSTDRTVEVARELGVEHFVLHARNMGLARSFTDGVDYALSHGADIVVNTDGDNQYPQERIPDLLAPSSRARPTSRSPTARPRRSRTSRRSRSRCRRWAPTS